MHVGIVGAGITGLALTHHLAERGVDCVTLEADAEPGGVIRSEHVDGLVLERGPQRVRRSPPIDSLIDACDLGPAVVESTELPLYVYADGDLGTVPFDARAFWKTDLLSLPGKARMLAEPLTRKGRPEETIGGVFRRKFGTEAYRNLFGPLYGGIYGSDPDRMPARHALSGLLEAEAETHSLLRAFLQRMGAGRQFPPMSFEDGLQQLPRALADRYDDRIRLDEPVVDIADGGNGYVLETAQGSEAVDRVVVTTPGPAAAELLDGLADGVEALRKLNYNPLAMVYLTSAFDRDGMGYQVGYGEDLHTLGASWNASLFHRDGLYTVFLGGMHEPGLVSESPERLGEIATAEFETATGAPAEVVDVHRVEQGFPAWDHTWDALDDLSTPEGVEVATNYTARMGVPSRVREAAAIADRLA